MKDEKLRNETDRKKGSKKDYKASRNGFNKNKLNKNELNQYFEKRD